MYLLNHSYKNNNELLSFIDSNSIQNKNNVLIQVFTIINDERALINLITLLKETIPNVKIIGATSKTEISSSGLHEEETIISFSIFEKTIIKTYLQKEEKDSYTSGTKLIKQLENPNDKDIKTAICFSNESKINGDDLLEGINSINHNIRIAGGIAGDYLENKISFTFTENEISTNATVLATLKNKDLNIITDYSFNWETVGKKHIVTKSIKNRVYEIDNIPTFEFYKKYLGEDISNDIISICVGIPLIIEKKNINMGRGMIKTYDDGSISYSGNIKEGSIVRFGYGNANLILEKSKLNVNKLINKPVEAIYIYSCLGRKKAFLSKSIDIEIQQYNKISPMCGFLTHGEFYHGKEKNCKNLNLNQTMTILAISESKEKKTHINIEKGNVIEEKYKRSLALNHLISKTSMELEDLTYNLKEEVKKEIKKNEEKDLLINITQAQAEVGSMLEMIAHQWRQPLSSISSIASTIQIKSELNKLQKNDLQKQLDEILNLSNFASQTIDDFRSLFKKNQKFKDIKISILIEKVKVILKSVLIYNQIKIEEEYLCSKDETIFIPLGQTLQVFINIIKNSIDAILENKIENPKIKFVIKKEDNFTIVYIEDNGGGIKEEHLAKIFEKRFTTKGITHGTGIGLDICKSIIEKNIEGKIKASNKDNGAVFEIKFPRKKEKID